jgi:hypothetical protein
MESVCLPFNDLDLVVNPFEFFGMDGEVAVIQNTVSISFQHFSKAGQRRVIYSLCQAAPIVQRLLRPGSGTIAPDVFEFLFDWHHFYVILFP